MDTMAQVGLIGLGVMGGALARNIANHHFRIAVYNRTTEKTQEYIRTYGNEYLTGTPSLKAFVASLERPRKVIIMVDAGAPVSAVIQQLVPLLETGDTVIDCGNSNYLDTNQRNYFLSEHKLLFLGVGVSGGEEGALHGPSIMVGGDEAAWKKTRPLFEAIAAKDFSGLPCAAYMEEDGAGHFVKMVHNGIEYGVMQLMAEAYDLLRTAYSLKPGAIADIFEIYSKGKLQSYLFDIAVPVLRKKDDLKHGYLIDSIKDAAGQKGTGRWTATEALEYGIALPTITQAVLARTISSRRDIRLLLSKQYKEKRTKPKLPLKKFVSGLEDALYAGLLSSYAEGYDLILRGGAELGWQIDLSEVSRIWEGGCIIRSQLLYTLYTAYQNTAYENAHLFTLPAIAKQLKKVTPSLRSIVALSATHGIPTPTLSASLSYFDSMRNGKLPANFIQGLRDYFGAHTYERINQDGTFHTDWKT